MMKPEIIGSMRSTYTRVVCMVCEEKSIEAPVYGWFTEGFDTLDLKEAKALLKSLTA
jgi:hypothetical protein